MSAHLTRRTRLLTAGLALGILLTACGGSDDDGADAGPTVLSQDSADSALLTLDDVGEGFVENTQPDEDETNDLGCLSGINDLDELEADTDAKVNFDSESDTALRSVLSGISSFEDEATITEAFDDFRTSIEDCKGVDLTDPSGFTITLAVTVVDGDLGDVDDQIHFTGTGQVSSGPGQTYSYDLAFVASRIDNNLSVVGLIDVGARGEDVIDSLAETAVERLNDAID